MNMSERSLHPSPAQLNALIDFLEKHPHLAKGIAKTQHAREKNRRQWDDLSLTLNSMGGTYKSPKQWTKYWSDKKSAVKKKAAVRAAARRNTGGGPEVDVIELSEAEERIVVLCGGETFGTGNAHSGIHLFPTPNLSVVMQCCITLIQSHGSVVERVIDDPAFQKILTLTPLTAEERGRVTSEAVRGMMEEEEEDCRELDTSEVQEQANETEIEVPMSVKDETGVIHWQCSCDEISGRHDDACAAAAVDYLQHYRMISAYRATCTICDKTLSWTSVATLRKHLQRQHPEVTVIGDHDDAEIPNSPPSPPSIVLTKVDPLGEIPPANKKRKFNPATDNEPIITQHDASSLDRFKSIDHPQELKSLDQFGLYVASLLKLLPRKRCIKYQNQIVDRLLKDLAAAA